MHHLARVLGLGQRRILVHEPGEQLLVEAAPIDADAHGLAVAERDLDDLGELPVALVLEADIAGIDAVFVERLGAGRMLGQQRVAVIMEVADERHLHAARGEPVADMRHGGRGLLPVDGDAHELGAGTRQRGHLRHRRRHVGGVGVGHGLHHDGRIAAERDAPHPHGNGAVARLCLAGRGAFLGPAFRAFSLLQHG